jgi:hypothetical protein
MTTTEIILFCLCLFLVATHYAQGLRYDRDRGNWQRTLDRALTREEVDAVNRVDAVDFLNGALPFRPFRAMPLTRQELDRVWAGSAENAGVCAVMQTLEEWIAKLNMEGHSGNELSRGGYVGVCRVYEELRGKMERAQNPHLTT